MLSESRLRVSIPVEDLTRARRFYTEKLGLTDTFENEFSVTFESGGGSVTLTHSRSAGQTEYSLLTWVVEDIDAVVKALRTRGVVFEKFDIPDVVMTDGVADFGGDRVAWFKDSEGNFLAVAQLGD